MAIKRLHYFDQQFLVEADFTDEQKYHLDMRRRLNRLLYTHGIAEGLVVAKSASKAVTVTPGAAIDRGGREMIVEAERVIDLSDTAQFPANATVFIAIAYQEQETDPSTATGAPGKTRVTEEPTVQAVTTASPTDGTVVRLARFTLDGSASVPGSVNDTFDGEVRQTVQSKAGAKIGDAVFSKVTLSNNSNQFPTLSSGSANRVDLQGNLVVSGSINSGTTGPMAVRGRLDSQTKNTVTNLGAANPGAAFVWNDPRDNNNNSVPRFGVVARVTTTPTALPVQPTVAGAAIAGISDIATVNGVYATAKSGTHALNVDGTARITGTISTTHLVDTFINASGQRLRTGDIVKLKGTAVSRFRGLSNKAPVAEVTVANKENDPCVIGIVDCEAIPDTDRPDTRVEPDDPTSIEDGGELYLVTLGVFAHCKADATEAPIEVGDLLTTSNHPGHAKKANNPRIGSIIGKALEPLKEGTGYIAVFVNIQ
jgi:hypothetical protein